MLTQVVEKKNDDDTTSKTQLRFVCRVKTSIFVFLFLFVFQSLWIIYKDSVCHKKEF